MIIEDEFIFDQFFGSFSIFLIGMFFNEQLGGSISDAIVIMTSLQTFSRNKKLISRQKSCLDSSFQFLFFAINEIIVRKCDTR